MGDEMVDKRPFKDLRESRGEAEQLAPELDDVQPLSPMSSACFEMQLEAVIKILTFCRRHNS